MPESGVELEEIRRTRGPSAVEKQAGSQVWLHLRSVSIGVTDGQHRLRTVTRRFEMESEEKLFNTSRLDRSTRLVALVAFVVERGGSFSPAACPVFVGLVSYRLRRVFRRRLFSNNSPAAEQAPWLEDFEDTEGKGLSLTKRLGLCCRKPPLAKVPSCMGRRCGRQMGLDGPGEGPGARQSDVCRALPPCT